ncbi:CDK2-associated and cullin domain-containing protein 1 isoform X1 [Petaurus breviceps papuanus]|uniref:CDK2-associated and cullin domain-containing protein 1 isoform X1 n=1 Tax=Petaurus breviceps papuanus TaxID=3040969 RepID=UPI0036D7AD6E
MEESMEEEEGGGGYEAMMDDQNHNNWEAAMDGYRQQPPPQPPPPSSSTSSREPPGVQLLAVAAAASERKGPKEGLGPPPEANGVAMMMMKSCDAAAAKAATAPTPSATININTSTSKFCESSPDPRPPSSLCPADPPLPQPRAAAVHRPESPKFARSLSPPWQPPSHVMNVITIEDYKSTYWPKLDGAIDQLLTQNPGDYIPISYEQIYSCVYKCVCQQHSEQMYSDLIKKITNHLERVSKELQASPPELYIERFNLALGQYMGALQSIVPLFIYMNKFYIETKLNRDLKDDLIKLFTEHVAEKHIYSLMPLLLEAQSTPFQITPSTMANIVKGLYTLRPEWVQMAPALFSKFIPNILPPAVESELQQYAAQDQKLQRDLLQNGFARGDQSRKRAGDELAYNGSSAFASSRGYR